MDDSLSIIDQHLLKSYRETIYRVEMLDLDIEIGKSNPSLNAFLRRQQAEVWAFVSAWNPGSRLLSLEENEKRHKLLVSMVIASNYSFYVGRGIGYNCDWEPEVSLFILNVPKAQAIAWAQHFQQNAIVFGKLDELPALILTTH